MVIDDHSGPKSSPRGSSLDDRDAVSADRVIESDLITEVRGDPTLAEGADLRLGTGSDELRKRHGATLADG